MNTQTINDADNPQKAGCEKRLVQLRVGSRFWMDFQGWTWPDCPHGDSEIVFVATSASATNGKSTLRGKGFGNPRPHYGNGSILANDSDLTEITKRPKAIIEANEELEQYEMYSVEPLCDDADGSRQHIATIYDHAEAAEILRLWNKEPTT